MMRSWQQRAGACLIWALTATAASAEDASGKAAARAEAALYDGIRTEQLDNGLRIYFKPVPGAPVVTVMVAYKVGSADEELDSTGLSHYLEHLMFKGTQTIMPGDIDRLTLKNGGANNAYTSEDCTVYHFDFASDRWDTALTIEADRMRNLCIDQKHEFEKEKGAVIQELMRNEDEPWDLEYKAILPLLFGKENPYGHPVIGEDAHVKAATAKIIKAHYDRWYHPNNAALIVCGGFDPDVTLAKIRKLFGPIPRGKLPPRKPAALPNRLKPIHKEMASKFEVPRMVMGFNTVRTGTVDYYPLEVLDALLSGGKTARLYRKLVEGAEVAGSVGSNNNTGRYPGSFAVQLELLPGKDRGKAEQLVLAELQRLATEPVGPEELQRAKRRLVAGVIFQRESVHGLADSIARGVTTNDLDFLKTYLTKIEKVTPAELQAAAKKYFMPEKRVVVWSIPKAGGGARAEPARRRTLARSGRAVAEVGATAFSLKDARRVVLDNGLTLLLYENHRLPIVAGAAEVRDVRLLEPDAQAGVAALMGRLLDEGTAKLSGTQIAEMIENVGGSLRFSSSGGSVRVLAPDRKLGLKLLFDGLSEADFPPNALERERRRLLSEIDDAQRQPDTRASMTYRALIYGQHPYGRPSLGRRPNVVKLTRDDVRAFHRRVFVPNNTMVALVGDFDSDQVIAEVKELTSGWKKTPLAVPEPAPVEKPAKFTQKILSMPDAAQLHFFMGHPGIKRDNPDYFKLLVMDYVLGTGPGFTDRLSARLRDREGLAYTVSANITSSAGEQPGVFTCYIGTEPQNFERVKKEFLEELTRIRAKPPTQEEVDGAKQYLLGSLPMRFTDSAAIGSQLLTIERYHLTFGYFDDYRKAVAAVTPTEVQAVAAKYLDPEHMILVAAGAVDAEGKELKKK